MSTPIERVQEYLRQRKRSNKDLGTIIHNIYTDPNAEMASLTIEDLEAALHDAWAEGAVAGWTQSGEGWNAEYPDESTGKLSVDLTGNPYPYSDTEAHRP